MRKQAIRYTAAGAVGVILVLALTFMLNWLGARHWRRFDWTSSHLYTLSEKTLNVLEGLDTDVRVVVFMTPASKLYEQVKELLDRYRAASPHIKVEFIDPDKEPLKTRQLAQQFGISAANTVVFAVGDRTKYITSDQMAEYDYSGIQFGQGPRIKSFKGEEQFTGAILSLVAPKVPKVYFVTGHGEASVKGRGMPGRSLAVLKEALKRENIEADDTSLLSGEVPKDADALVIAGPTAPYAEQEVEALDRYLDRGGRLLVCLDPLLERDGTMRHVRLEKQLARRGVEFRDDLVVDPSRRLPFFDLSAVYLTDFRSHDVTKGMEGLAVLFPVTRSLGSGSGDGYTARPIIETTAKGWGETDLAGVLRGRVDRDDRDHKGPVAVAVVAEARTDEGGTAGKKKHETSEKGAAKAPGGEKGAESPRPWRIVAFGDSDFLTDGQIANAGNLTLALNAFHWLVEQEEALGIPPRAVEQVSLFLSREQLRAIFLLVLVGMPAAAIVLGIVVWRRRRH